MNQETRIQHQIQLALSEAGCLAWRNETSGAWLGKVIHKAGNQVTLTDAHMMTFGLCVGSSDLIGCTPVVITEDMVGQTIGCFTAIEVKTPKGRPTNEQTNFIDAVLRAGGIAGIARSPEEALRLLTL